MQGRGAGFHPAPRQHHGRFPLLTARLQQVAKDLSAAGVPLQQFLSLWAEQFGTLCAADYGEFSVEDVIQKHSQTQLLVINKRLPGQPLPQLFVIPRPTKQQLENAVRKAQEQLHNQGLSVTLGSLDCALAQAFGLTGSLSDLGYQPRDLGPIQDLLTVERNATVLIATFLRARPVCTLADLDAYLAQQHKVDSYNDLRMGPLLQHELVLANFRPPEHLVEIPQVFISDVVDVIADCMEERRPKRNQQQSKMTWEDVRLRLAARFEVPFEDLCVRMPPGEGGLGIFITGMVSGWKSEREQLHSRIKSLSVQKKMLAGKCGAELHEVAQGLVLGHAARLHDLVVNKMAALQAAAANALKLFAEDETTLIQTRFVLQPLPLVKLQALLQQLLHQVAQRGSTASSMARGILQAKKSRSKKAEQGNEEVLRLSSSIIFKAVDNPAEVLTVLNPTCSSAYADMEHMLQGSCLQSLKQLFSGDVQQAAKAVNNLLVEPLSMQMMQAAGTAAAPASEGLADAAEATAAPLDAAGLHALPPPPPPSSGGQSLLDACGLPSHLLGLQVAASKPAEALVGSDDNTPASAEALNQDAAASSPRESITSSSSSSLPVSVPELAPDQLSELLWTLLDAWHDVLWRQQQQRRVERDRLEEQREHEELMLQIGMDPDEARQEARLAAEKRAKQQAALRADTQQLDDGRLEARWWRQQPLPPVFGSSSEEAALQLSAVSSAAGELVNALAGPVVADRRLIEVLSHYWQHDAMLQLLLHAVRVLMEHGAARQPAQQEEAEEKEQQQSSEEEQQPEEPAAAAARSVGLPELLSAVQELGKGASLHALRQLEEDLLKRFDVPSFGELQLPAGCKTLLGALESQDELAAALTGYADAWDCGAVPLEDVLRVVMQALINLRHGARGRNKTHSEGAIARAVSAALCSHFKVAHVLRLGYGPVQGLMREAEETAGLAATPSGPTQGADGAASATNGGTACWSALALTSNGAAHFTAHASGLSVPHGLAILASAPVLSDLSTWSDWDMLYSPGLGPLPAFLSKHQQQLGFRALEVPGGGLLKLPAVEGSLDLQQLRAGLKQALEQDQPAQLVGLLLLHITQQGGLASAHDLVMLGDLLASLLAADVSRHQAGTSGSSSRSWMQTIGSSGAAGGGSGAAFLTPEAALRQLQGLSAAQQRVVLFMLQCLQLLPVPVASSVAGDVLLRPLGPVMGWEPEVVHWALLVAAVAAEAPAAAAMPRAGTQAAAVAASLKAVAAKGRVAGARQRLHALGFTQLGVAAWQDDCLGSIAWQAAAQQQHRQQQEALKAAAVAVPDPAATGSAGGAAGGAGVRDAEKLPQEHGTAADGTDMAAAAGGTVTAAAGLEGQSGVDRTAAAAVHSTDTTDGPLSTPEAAAVDVPVPPETAVACDAAASADGALADNMGSVAASSPVEDEAATVATAEPDSSLIPGASVDEPSGARVDHEVEELAVVTAAGGSVLGDLSEIADPCQRQIEEHRRLRGIGMNLRGEAAAFAKAQIRTIGNAIKKLSSELYTKDVHFMMELVQNADDNSYTPAAGLPVLELITSSSAVSCLNNEVGFTRDDVDGICEVGGSKKQGKAGFTGQKGIGFKAVFRITNCPQIHSSGYHFAFDLKKHPELGYVLPTWIKDEPLQPSLLESLHSSVLARLLQQQQHQQQPDQASAPADAGSAAVGPVLSRLLGPSNMTWLHLPLKPGSEDVGQKLSGLRPTLLLFLRQLRCLVLSDTEAGTSKVMMRLEDPGTDFVRLLVRTVTLPPAPDYTSGTAPSRDLQQVLRPQAGHADGDNDGSSEQQALSGPVLSPSAVEALLSSQSQCEVLLQEESRWLVVTDTFSPGEICRLGYEVDATTVSLAFGIHEAQPSQKEVFAFLPVRRYGLNFIVQGDFVVPSSRGDIDLDDPFNQLLHSKVPGLFASSFTKFKAMPPPEGQQPLYWMDWWLKCVPLPEHMHEFFSSLPEEVASHLQALPCIPTEADDGSVGPWVPPGNALVCSSPHIKELVSAEQLARLQGKYFVHPSLSSLCEPRSELRRLLRIREFDPQEVICLVRDMAAAGELSGHSIPQLRQLLVTVFGLLFGVGLSTGSGSGAAGAAQGLGSSAGSSSIRVQGLLKELRECPLLPLYGRPGMLLPARVNDGAGSSSSSTVFFPVEGLGAAAAAAPAGKGANSSRQRPQSALSGPNSTPAQLAASALNSCGFTQQQLAGLGAAGPADGSNIGAGLLFVDPELLQLEDAQQRSIMVQGLKGLGVREVEPLDIVHGYILPQLSLAADRCKQQADLPAAESAAAASPAEAAAGTTSQPGRVQMQVDKGEQLHLMRLLAFPLAARLLDMELGAASPWQQQQQGSSSLAAAEYRAQGMRLDSSPGHPGSSSSSGQPGHQSCSLLMQLARVAVLVTNTGHAALAPCCGSKHGLHSSSNSGRTSAPEEEQDIFLPKQLGNQLDLPQLFPAYSWTLVSSNYASCCASVDAQQWSLLMQAFGVKLFLPVCQDTVELTWKQLMVEQRFAAWRDAVVMDNSQRYDFVDWHWRSLQRLLSSIAADADPIRREKQYRSLASVVTAQWPLMQASGQLHCSYSMRCVEAEVKKGAKPPAEASAVSGDASSSQRKRRKAVDPADAEGGKVKGLSAGAASWQPGRQKLPSSVMLGLQTWEWLLASDGKAHAPTELFARQQDIQQLFKHHVLYIVPKDITADIARALGATCDSSAETVLQVLTSWSTATAHTATAAPQEPAEAAEAASSSSSSEAGSFTTTLHDMSQLYHHLSRFMNDTELSTRGGFSILLDPNKLDQLPQDVVVRLQVSKAFNDTPLIWLPDTEELLCAAAAYRAEERQRSYYDDDMGFNSGRNPPGGAGGFGAKLGSGLSSSSARQRGSRLGRGAALATVKRDGAGRLGATNNASDTEPVPADAMYDAALISALAHKPLRGRFYLPDELRFSDDAKVFELTYPVLHKHFGSSSGQPAAAGTQPEARPPPMLRALGAYYGSQRRLFVDQLQRFKYDKWIPLVGMYPTFGDYCRTADGIITATGDKAVPDTFSYKTACQVLSTWCEGISRGSITAIAQQRLYNELAGPRGDKPWKLLPGRGGEWLSLLDHPHVPDDSELLGLFEDVAGITFLDAPGTADQAAVEQGNQSDRPQSGTSRPAAPAASPAGPPDLSTLWFILQVPHLSQVVELGPAYIQPTASQPDRQLSLCLAVALPLLQRHLLNTLPQAEYRVLDAALGPRWPHFQVLAVTELARVHIMRVLNSDMAADAQVVSRDGASWVQRKQACLALLDLAPEELPTEAAEADADADQDGPAAGSTAAVAGEAMDDTSSVAESGAADPAEPGQAGSSSTCAAAEAGEDAAAATTASAAAPDSTELSNAAGAAGVPEECVRCDALYVVCPERLMECCHQVSAEVSAYIGLMAEEAGCTPLAVNDLTALLEKLLMVQATGGDVSQVMRQPPYSSYLELPDTTTPWQLHVPPEPEPGPEPEPEPASEPEPELAAQQQGDESELQSPRASEDSAAAAAEGDSRPGQLPGLGLDLSELLTEPTEESSALDAVHQWRVEHEAAIKAKIEAAAAARAAQAAADATSAAAAGSSGTAGATAAAQQPREHNPLVISSEILPAVVAARRADTAALPPAPQLLADAAHSSTAVVAAADYHQEVVVVVPQGSPAAAPGAVQAPSLTSPDKVVIVAGGDVPAHGTPYAEGGAAAATGGYELAGAAAGLEAASSARRHLDMAAAAAEGGEGPPAAAAAAGASHVDTVAESAAVQLLQPGLEAPVFGTVPGSNVLQLDAAAAGVPHGLLAGPPAEAPPADTPQYSLFPAAGPQSLLGGTEELPIGFVPAAPDALSAQQQAESGAAAAQAAAGAVPAGARVPQLVFMGVPTFSLLGPTGSMPSGTLPEAATALRPQYAAQSGLQAAGPAAAEDQGYNRAMADHGSFGSGFGPAQGPAGAPPEGYSAAYSTLQQQQQEALGMVPGQPGAGPAAWVAAAGPPAGYDPTAGPPAAAVSAGGVGGAGPYPGAPQQQGVGTGLPGPLSSTFPGQTGHMGVFDHGLMHQDGNSAAAAAAGQQSAPAGALPHGAWPPHSTHRDGFPPVGEADMLSGRHFSQQQQQLQQQGVPGVGGSSWSGLGPWSPPRAVPAPISWQQAEGAARAAGLISEEVPLPLQMLAGLHTPLLPAAPQQLDAGGASADMAAVGRFGEELAYLYYMQHPDVQHHDIAAAPGSSSPQLIVEWVNQHQESWLPFDLALKEAATGAVMCYVEVKATRDTARQFFDMTCRELEFATQQGDRYHVLRVKGVGSGSPTLERLINPVRLWRQQAIRVCVVL